MERATAIEAAKIDNQVIGNNSSCSTSDIHKVRHQHNDNQRGRIETEAALEIERENQNQEELITAKFGYQRFMSKMRSYVK